MGCSNVIVYYCLFFKVFIFFIIPVINVAAWRQDMPGGMKLFINGDIYSFTTAQCPGGVFLKDPMAIRKACIHGYFLRRQNGCKMEGSDIISGSNYVCLKGDELLNQAFIPLTDPDSPLDHTVSLYDEADSLKNFRRFTYDRGIEGRYQESSKHHQAIGAIVANPRKIPKITIENICYKGLNGGGALWGEFSNGNVQDHSIGLFTSTCKSSAETFPWTGTKQYFFTKGDSFGKDFNNEIWAAPLKDLSFRNSASNDLSHFEIWNGLAYCLQELSEETVDHKIVKSGIVPSISSLKQHCNQLDVSAKKNGENSGLMYKLLVEEHNSAIQKRSADSEFEVVDLPTGACRKPARRTTPPPAQPATTQAPIIKTTLPLCPPDEEDRTTPKPVPAPAGRDALPPTVPPVAPANIPAAPANGSAPNKDYDYDWENIRIIVPRRRKPHHRRRRPRPKPVHRHPIIEKPHHVKPPVLKPVKKPVVHRQPVNHPQHQEQPIVVQHTNHHEQPIENQHIHVENRRPIENHQIYGGNGYPIGGYPVGSHGGNGNPIEGYSVGIHGGNGHHHRHNFGGGDHFSHSHEGHFHHDEYDYNSRDDHSPPVALHVHKIVEPVWKK